MEKSDGYKIGAWEEPPSMMKDQIEDTSAQSAASPPHPFKAIFDQVAIGIAYVALNGQLLYVNQQLCDITGYTQEDLLQRTLLEITPPEEQCASQAFFQECINEHVHGRNVEKRYIRKDGLLIWVSVTPSLVKKATGEPDYIIAVVQDISERKRAEEEHARLEGRTQEVLNALLAIAEALVAVPDSEREDRPYVAEG